VVSCGVAEEPSRSLTTKCWRMEEEEEEEEEE